ncbi:hypothetical protein [Azospirillum sp. B510]|uniref:hypothetical protein n=1 Tax=Azospirillum sp. (strain B510) TaxID=137722 RepID=UPI000306D239|nr:hypothetical protein [Azospirillum sp. B510]
MAGVDIVVSRGFNQEFRQNPNTSPGYIYNYATDDETYFVNQIAPFLPPCVSFSADPANDPLVFTADTPGQSALACCSTIYPYPGDAPASLPRQLGLSLSNGLTVTLTLIARILSIVPLAGDSPSVQWAKGEIERQTSVTFPAGAVLQEIISPEGGRYALVAAFGDSGYDVTSLDGLADLPLPTGYTYQSSVLSSYLTLAVEQTAHILICGSFNFQLYA